MDSLKCGYCKERYNMEYNKPVKLDCGDTLCEVCFTDSKVSKESYKCPFDGRKFAI